jgi:general secretion pathway protein C
VHLSPHHIALILTLSGLGTSAFFFAQGTTELAAAELLAVEIPTGAGGGRQALAPPPGVASRRNRSTRDIMARNIFVAPVESDGGVVETTAETVIEYQYGQEPSCGPDIHLVGAIVTANAPEWSYAALIQGQGPARLFRMNMPFAGKTLVEVTPQRVLLKDASGTPCQARMFDAAPTGETPQPVAGIPTPASPAAPTLAAATGAEITPAEMDEGITRESDTRFSVQRGLLDRALSQQESIFRTARLVPHEENGAVVGMRVYGIRRSSLLGRLGVQNGDMLRSMNGFEMNDADAMLTALGRLRTANDLSLSVVRRGAPVTIDYSVR